MSVVKIWNLLLKIPSSTSRAAGESVRLRKETLKLKQEMQATNAQDEFAKWAKLRRQHDKSMEQYEKISTFFFLFFMGYLRARVFVSVMHPETLIHICFLIRQGPYGNENERRYGNQIGPLDSHHRDQNPHSVLEHEIAHVRAPTRLVPLAGRVASCLSSRSDWDHQYPDLGDVLFGGGFARWRDDRGGDTLCAELGEPGEERRKDRRGEESPVIIILSIILIVTEVANRGIILLRS